MSVRSWLYVPGDDERKLTRVLERGADAIIVDLEDGVSAESKGLARETAARWLQQLPDRKQRPIWIRVNPEPLWEEDLRSVASPRIAGVCLAKVDSVDQVKALSAFLDAEDHDYPIQALIESASGVLEASAIARLPRISQLQLGEEDLRADLGASATAEEDDVLIPRSLIVLASAAARLRPPVGAVQREFQNDEALVRSSALLRALGFGSRACIHPRQAAIINEVFAPTPEELETAAGVVAAYEAAERAGTGVSVDKDGAMVDEAVVRRAKRTLAEERRDAIEDQLN